MTDQNSSSSTFSYFFYWQSRNARNYKSNLHLKLVLSLSGSYFTILTDYSGLPDGMFQIGHSMAVLLRSKPRRAYFSMSHHLQIHYLQDKGNHRCLFHTGKTPIDFYALYTLCIGWGIPSLHTKRGCFSILNFHQPSSYFTTLSKEFLFSTSHRHYSIRLYHRTGR